MRPMGAVGAELETAADVVGRQGWLDPLADTVQGALGRLWASTGDAGRLVKNALHGTWLGHPLHPVLTDVPIGAWTAAVVLDVAAASGGSRALGAAAGSAIAVGIAGAAGAAVTGLTDWQHTDGEARRTGLAHGLLNTTALSLFTASLVLRRRGAARAGRGSALLGYAVAMTAAYLGGSLVYRHRVGVDHAHEGALPHQFVRVLRDGDLGEGEPRRAEAGSVRLVLVRRAGRIHALLETCAHLGGPLAEGRVDGDTIVCPWHGSRFALEDGHVVDGPATFPQPCLEARVREGWIEVRAAR